MLSRVVFAAAVLIRTLTAQSANFFPFNLTSNASDLLNYGPARLARIFSVDSMMFDAQGNLYLNELGIIRRITPDGTIAPLRTPVPNQLAPVRYQAMTIDPAGNLFFLSYINNNTFELLRLTPAGVLENWVEAGEIPPSTLTAMAAGNQGELYVLGLSRVTRVGPDRRITAFA